jgi:hypothetical protein
MLELAPTDRPFLDVAGDTILKGTPELPPCERHVLSMNRVCRVLGINTVCRVLGTNTVCKESSVMNSRHVSL